MRLFGFLLAVAVFISAAAGCEEKVRPPAPPVGDASAGDATITRPPRPRRDGGAGDGALDGAMDATPDSTPDASLPPGCFVAGEGTATNAAIALEGATFPFLINRSYATWDPDRCRTIPTILVGLTEGACTPTGGDQLIFSLAREAIGTNIFVSINILSPEPDDLGLTVRFRSVGAGGGSEEWGTCAGSSGTVDFTSLDSIVGTRLTATYDMILTDCRAPLDSSPITVTGTFDVPLDVSFETICL